MQDQYANNQQYSTQQAIYNNVYSGIDDPLNAKTFLRNKSYGQAPANTTLTINYLYGGGIKNNVASNTLQNIQQIQFQFNSVLNQTGIVQSIKNSITTVNEQMATGGSQYLNIQQMKQNIKL